MTTNNFNFKTFTSSDGGGRPPGTTTTAAPAPAPNTNYSNFPLTRQPSIYSLTFDEFQTALGGSVSKDFGSMNMDELLKNIWSAEETQNTTSTAAAAVSSASAVAPGDGIQRQGSFTLPRTLSVKTVDEVWRDISKEYAVTSGGAAAGGGGGSDAGGNVPHRQQTLGEMTLEEFLVRAGVVREDAQILLNGKANNIGNSNFGGGGNSSMNGGYGSSVNLGFGFNQNGGFGLRGVNGSTAVNSVNGNSATNLPLDVNGLRPSQNQQQQQQPIFPKQQQPQANVNVGFTGQLPNLQAAAAAGAAARGGIAGDLSSGGLMQGLVGLGGGVVAGSPAGNQLSSDGIGKNNNGDSLSSVSPVPYVFNGGLRGRRAAGAVEKVVERRQRRMIKNRESAARSRARKQVNVFFNSNG